MKTLSKSLVVEAALAGLFAAALPVFAADAPKAEAPKDAPKAEKKSKAKKPAKAAATVHCLGVNACKGTSECGVDGAHACKGHNECKGKGWTALSAKDCAAQKGTVQGKKGGKTETAPAPAK
ncbi:MAG: hypothetical protein HY923_09765 [Elusimicrobia bacterium]|nr:hypothetical protein [Elusimicrobiota bacterium]